MRSKLMVFASVMVLLFSGKIFGAVGKIVFESKRDGWSQIYMMNSDGSNLINLTNGTDHEFSHDFSWDGSKIAFLAFSNDDPDNTETEIYTIDAHGSNKQRLTYTPEHEYPPAISPDGTKIFFRRDEHVYMMNSDGTGLTEIPCPVEMTNPRFSPDGTKIVFDNFINIYTMNVDGSNVTQLTYDDNYNQEPSFSPDGTKITFITYSENVCGIAVMNADGSNLVKFPMEMASEPTFSPDGTKIVVGASGVIYMMDWDGQNVRQIIADAADGPIWRMTVGESDSTPPIAFNVALPVDNATTWDTAPTFSWTRSEDLESGLVGYDLYVDGVFNKRVGPIVTATEPAFPLSMENHTWQVKTINGEGMTTETLVRNINIIQYQASVGKIVFQSSCDGPGKIYMMNPDGTNRISLSDMLNWSEQYEDASPSFSQDGSMVVFLRSFPNGQVEVFTANADCTNLVQITNNPEILYKDCPILSPNNQQIVFSGTEVYGIGNYVSSIYKINIDGTNLTKLVYDIREDGHSCFSPDGSKILFSCIMIPGAERTELWTMNSDGSNRQQLTDAMAGNWQDNTAFYSPNGDKIVFTRGLQGGYGTEIYTMNADDGSNVVKLTDLGGASYSCGFSPDGTKILFYNILNSMGLNMMDCNGQNIRNIIDDNTITTANWQLTAPVFPPFVVESSESVVAVDYQNATLNGNPTPVYVTIIDETTPESESVIALALEEGYQIFSNLYDIGPNNTIFSPPAVMTFEYEHSQIPPEVSEDELQVITYHNGAWGSPLPVVARNIDENWIKVEVNMLSLFAIVSPSKTTPVVKIITPSAQGIVKGVIPVNVSLSDNSGVKKVEFYVDEVLGFTNESTPYNWNWDTMSVIDGTHTVKVMAYDSGNNSSSDSVRVNVDNTVPCISLISPLGGEKFLITKSSITISFSVTDNLDPAPVSNAYLTDIAQGTTVQVSNGQIIDPVSMNNGFWTLTVAASDWVNNSVSSSTQQFQIVSDNQPPRTSLIISQPQFGNETLYITRNTSFTITSVDDWVALQDNLGLGVAFIEYGLNEQTTANFVNSNPQSGQEFVTAPFVFDALSEGNYNLNYFAVDTIGNREITKTKNIAIDNTVPVTTLTMQNGAQWTASDGKIYASIGTQYVLTAIDTIVNNVASGLEKTEYRIDEGDFTPYTEPLSLNEGTHTICYRSIDKVTNIEVTKSLIVYVDNTVSVSNITMGLPKYVSETNTWITSVTEFVLNANDGTGSGVSKIQWKLDAGDWIDYVSTVTVTNEGAHTLGYRSIDNVGNIEAVKNMTVIVDNTSPLTTIFSDGPRFADYVTSLTTFMIDVIDNGIIPCGVKMTEYQIGIGWLVYDTPFRLSGNDGIYTINYRSKDYLDNLEVYNSTTVKLDNTPPITVLSMDDSQYGQDPEQPVVIGANTKITLAAVDTIVNSVASGIKEIRYEINNSGEQVYSQPFTLTQPNGEVNIKYYSLDNVSNVELTKSTTVMLDVTPPTVQLISPSPDSSGVCQIFKSSTPIYGTISDPYFENYKVEYAAGKNISDDSFITIFESTIPVTADKLAMWDTLSLVDGWYTLRITAQDKIKNAVSVNVNVCVGQPKFVFSYQYDNDKPGVDIFKPAYIAIDSMTCSYVTDHYIGRVIKFDAEGEVVSVFGSSKRDNKNRSKGNWRNRLDLDVPEGIALDSVGNIYVADRLNNRVVKLDAEGNLVMEIGGKDNGCWKDNRWCKWAVDDDDDDKDKKNKCSLRCHGEKTFNHPTGVVIDSDNNIWVADRFNSRLQKFTTAGMLVEESTIDTGIYDTDKKYRHWKKHWSWWQQKPFERPGGIAIDTDNNLYIANQFDNRVIKFNSTTTERMLEIGSDAVVLVKNKKVEKYGSGGSQAGQFKNPDGIFVTKQGYIYVTEQDNHRIQKFDRYGNVVMVWGSKTENKKKTELAGGTFKTPGGIFANSNGNLYVVDRDNYRIQVFGLPEEELKVTRTAASINISRQAAAVESDSEAAAFVLRGGFIAPNPCIVGNGGTVYTSMGKGGVKGAMSYSGGVRMTIQCGLADKVYAKVYNIVGELVYEGEVDGSQWQIVNGKYTYTANWRPEGMAAGIYICILTAEKSGSPSIRKSGKLAIMR